VNIQASGYRVLYIPQFFGGQPVRIAHGALLAAGCLCLAAGLWRTRSGTARPPGPAPVPRGRDGIGLRPLGGRISGAGAASTPRLGGS
jgi:hypothetical protein